MSCALFGIEVYEPFCLPSQHRCSSNSQYGFCSESQDLFVFKLPSICINLILSKPLRGDQLPQHVLQNATVSPAILIDEPRADPALQELQDYARQIKKLQAQAEARVHGDARDSSNPVSQSCTLGQAMGPVLSLGLNTPLCACTLGMNEPEILALPSSETSR